MTPNDPINIQISNWYSYGLDLHANYLIIRTTLIDMQLNYLLCKLLLPQTAWCLNPLVLAPRLPGTYLAAILDGCHTSIRGRAQFLKYNLTLKSAIFKFNISRFETPFKARKRIFPTWDSLRRTHIRYVHVIVTRIINKYTQFTIINIHTIIGYLLIQLF